MARKGTIKNMGKVQSEMRDAWKGRKEEKAASSAKTLDAPQNAKPSLDGISKQKALDAEMEWAKVELMLETLETRKRDSLDFHEIPVWSIRDLVRHAFEAGYREGLHTGYRQGRGDAAREAAREEAPTSPRNPELAHTA